MISDFVRRLANLAISEGLGLFWTFPVLAATNTGGVGSTADFEEEDSIGAVSTGGAFDEGAAFDNEDVGADLVFSAGLGSGVCFLGSGILKLGPMMNSDSDFAMPPWTFVIFLGSDTEFVDRENLGFGGGRLNVLISSSEERLISRSNSSPMEFDTCLLAFGLDLESGARRLVLLSPASDGVVGELEGPSSENTDDLALVALSVGFMGALSRLKISVFCTRDD